MSQHPSQGKHILVLIQAWIALFMLLVPSAGMAGAKPYLSYSYAIEPWGIMPGNNGIMPEFIRFLAKAAGLEIRTEVRPYLRVEEGLLTGSNSIMMGSSTAARERAAIALCKPVGIKIFISYRKEDVVAPELTWFKGKNVGELRGSRTFDKFDRTVPHNILVLNDMVQGFKMLEARHLDGTICIRPGCGSAMKLAGVNTSRIGEVLYDEVPIVVYVSKNSPLSKDSAAMQRLRNACESPEGKRAMKRILAQYD